MTIYSHKDAEAGQLTRAGVHNVEPGTHVLVHVGSGDVLRPAIVDRLTTTRGPKWATDRTPRPTVLVSFVWANGRVTHGRVFGTARDTGENFGVYLAPEPHTPATVAMINEDEVAEGVTA